MADSTEIRAPKHDKHEVRVIEHDRVGPVFATALPVDPSYPDRSDTAFIEDNRQFLAEKVNRAGTNVTAGLNRWDEVADLLAEDGLLSVSKTEHPTEQTLTALQAVGAIMTWASDELLGRRNYAHDGATWGPTETAAAPDLAAPEPDLSLITREAVLAAIDEYDQLGRDNFLIRHGYGQSKQYFLEHDDSSYDSKAIVGVAHGYLPGRRTLHPSEFSGGKAVVQPLLENLGFDVRIADDPAPVHDPGAESRTGAPTDVSYKAFRADPDRYRIESAIATLPVDTWTTSGRHVSAGDHVAFYRLAGRQGAARGVIGFGVVLTDPEPMVDLDSSFWTNPEDGAEMVDRVKVRYVKSPNGELLEQQHKVVADLSASRAHGGTVFNMTAKEWEQLVALAGLPGADLRGHDDPTADRPLPPPQKRDDSEPPAGAPSNVAPQPVDMAARADANVAVGRLGEEWVVEHEQQRLTKLGHPDLAASIEHVAVTKGDGLGYDVLSFDEDGTPRRIEVKTTRGGPGTSFYASSNEVRMSRELAPEWVLYRVHDINGIPQLRTSRTPLDEYPMSPVSYLVAIDD